MAPVAVAASFWWSLPGAAGAVGFTGQEPSELEAFEECEAAGQASDWDSAAARCETALAAFPDNFGIHYFLGFAYQGRQEWDRAATAFEAFIAAAEAEASSDAGESTPPRFTEEVAQARRNAGIARVRAGDFDAAVPLLRQVREGDPADAEAAFMLGVAELERGESAAAATAFAAAVAEVPEMAPAQFLLGRLRYEAGVYPEARERLEQYLAAEPAGSFSTEAHWIAGSIALRALAAVEEDEEPPAAPRDRAIHHFSGFLEGEPAGSRAATAHYFLATFLEDSGACEAARDHYRRFLEIAPDHERAAEVREYLAHESSRCGVPGPAPA